MGLLLATFAQAAGPQQVLYAGTGYLSSAEDLKSKFPHLCALAGQNPDCFIPDYRIFYDQIVGYSNDRVVISDQQSTDLRNFMLAVAFESETVEEVFALGKRNLRLGLVARVILYDFQKKNLLANYPISVGTIITCTQDADCSDQRQRAEFHKLIFDVQQNSIIRFLPSRLGDITIDTARFFIEIADVEIADRVYETLGDQAPEPQGFEKWLASSLEGYLFNNIRIPILPYTRGQAIAGKMPLKIANSDDAFDIELPPASFSIKIKLRGLLKKMLDETDHRAAYSYISAIGLQIDGRLATYLDQKYQRGNVIKIPKSDAVSDVDQFRDSILILLNETTTQLAKPNKKWIKDHKSDKKARVSDLVKEIKALEETVFVKVR
jgi:hypothetical protein